MYGISGTELCKTLLPKYSRNFQDGIKCNLGRDKISRDRRIQWKKDKEWWTFELQTLSNK